MQPATRPRLVTTVHGPYSVNAYSAIMTHGERIVAISEFIRRYVLDNYPAVPAARVEVIHRGIAPEEYPHGYRPDAAWQARWRQDFPALQGRPVITLPARVTRWKGHEVFFAIIARLKVRGLPVHGLIAGGAERRRAGFLQTLHALVNELDVGDCISFLGARTDLRDVMAISSAVVSLARAPEAFGRTTLEALALGVPVAGYDHGGTSEILGRLFPAGLCPVGDLDAMADRLARFHASPPAVPPVQEFSLQRMLDQELALYERLAAEPRV
jgi:glycosyltransferase involved in cell wall biosynthesis